jgi:hypothetical protein
LNKLFQLSIPQFLPPWNSNLVQSTEFRWRLNELMLSTRVKVSVNTRKQTANKGNSVPSFILWMCQLITVRRVWITNGKCCGRRSLVFPFCPLFGSGVFVAAIFTARCKGINSSLAGGIADSCAKHFSLDYLEFWGHPSSGTSQGLHAFLICLTCWIQ